ncbi:DUF4293 domain-containing protein [Prevotella sp. E15-22]|uniref:DUF4293 family protein n=1 Tax=Prevotella sp. E15-22 TaxID=2937774 RepID=UPI00204EFAEC|nr:DUF4293 family protein [Prevotella sp. E15-22]UPS43384.1 DUF4293 domain-containing protein [Prevotella sp. E15-22]
MIQRIQTVYLLLALILLVVGLFVGRADEWIFNGLSCIMMAVTLRCILLFKNRPAQSTWCLVLMLMGVAYYIILAVKQPTIDWYHAMPLAAVLLTFVARKRIIKDEKLVRSLDRIR